MSLYKFTNIPFVGAFFCMIWYVGLPPAIMGWAASCGDGPWCF